MKKDLEAVSSNRWQYGIKNKAANGLQCKLNDKLIAALLFIQYSSLIWGDTQWVMSGEEGR